jgi:UDP-N-acetylglucosamine 2-epimerase (non-hydrolysing)
MKVVTIVGTRPEIIRLSRVIPLLDRFCTHRLVHTGQNYDPLLSDVFFEQLGVRAPDIHLGITAAGFAPQVGQLLPGVARVLEEQRPDRILVLGDTNSGLAAIVAARMGIPVFHMEAGNRCYDDRVPEEVNRRVIDHSSDVLMPYTERSRANLLREGIASNRIFVTGNPIKEVIEHYRERIDASDALRRLTVEPGKFFLVTMHRAENVDLEPRLRALTTALEQLHAEYGLPIICSLHPRTRNKMLAFGLNVENAQIRFMEPLGLFDFIALEQKAFCVLSDSGTVQEECCLFRVPNVTIRDVTERPETLECGSNMLAGADPAVIRSAVKAVLSLDRSWSPPPEYVKPEVTSTVLKIVLGYDHQTSLK